MKTARVTDFFTQKKRDSTISNPKAKVETSLPVVVELTGTPIRRLRPNKGTDAVVTTTPQRPALRATRRRPIADPVESIKPEEPTKHAEVAELELPITKVCRGAKAQGLNLPTHLQSLFEIFKQCDQVMFLILAAKRQLATFEKLKTSVETVSSKLFTEVVLGQILTIYPEAYKLRWEKIGPLFPLKVDATWKLVIEAPSINATVSPMSSPVKQLPGGLTNSPVKMLDHPTTNGSRSALLLERRETFHMGLVDYTRQAHRRFLVEQLHFQESDLPDDANVKRWHGKFQQALERVVPRVTVPEGTIPSKPQDSPTKLPLNNLQQVAEQYRLQRKCLQSPTKPLSQTPASPAPMATTSSPVTPVKRLNNEFKNLPAALLEKIRRKEAERAQQRAEFGSTSEVMRRSKIARLPNVAHSLWALSMRGKHLMPVPHSQIIGQITASMGLSAESAAEHLNLLVELLPTWVEVVHWAELHYKLLEPKRSLLDVERALREHLTK